MRCGGAKGTGSGRRVSNAVHPSPLDLVVADADVRGVKRLSLVVVAVGLLAAAATPVRAAAPPAGLGECPIFPADSFWHADVRSLPVHPQSATWLANMGGPTRRLHPDFGDSGEAQPYGIPYAIVDSSHPKVTVDFDYADESDLSPYPFGPDIPIEGGSDRHALMLDRDTCTLSELFAADWNGGEPTAGSGAIFDLRSNALRPSGWTSADAAGLAIFPGLLRRDEVLSGRIDHPIRMTAQQTDRSFVWPARHQAGARRDPNLPPMGAWFRLRADYPTEGLHPHTVVILEAFKTHGLILADNGSNWYFTGAADAGWESRVLNELKALQAGSFEAIDQSSLMVDPNSGAVRGASPAPAPAPTTTAAPAPAPASTPAPVPTTARRTLTPPPGAAVDAAPPTTTSLVDAPTETSTIPPLPTTAPVEPVADEATDGDDAVAAPTKAPASRSRGPLLAALAALVVTAGAAAVVVVMLRRRRAAGTAAPLDGDATEPAETAAEPAEAAT